MFMLEPSPLPKDPLFPPEEQLQLQFPHETEVGPHPPVVLWLLPEHTTVTLVPLVPLVPGTTITVVVLVVVVLVVVEPGPVVITVVVLVMVVLVTLVVTTGVVTPQAVGAGREVAICNAVCKQTKGLHFGQTVTTCIHSHSYT